MIDLELDILDNTNVSLTIRYGVRIYFTLIEKRLKEMTGTYNF